MTSNLGSLKRDPPGFETGETSYTSYDRAAQTFFRPEFYNRIDAVLSFHPLDRNSVHRIVEKELTGLMNREGLKKRGIDLSWTPNLVSHLVRRGFSARFGARPLQRTIEAQVVVPLASYLNREHPRGAKLSLDIDENDRVIIVP
jgi:ATP-dependent Clp protease ATP-binding subunit ClpA